MKKYIKKSIVLGMVLSLILSMVQPCKISFAEDITEYVVMEETIDGNYDIYTKEMSSYEAAYLNRKKDVIIDENIEFNGFGELENSSSEEFIKDVLDCKEPQEMLCKQKETSEFEDEWNLQQVNADTNRTAQVVNTISGSAIKVALIDSGVDYSDDVDVYCRKNFVPGDDEISILYEDYSGHGTSVAGIIAAKDNGEGITGINSNVILYSAKVLDDECKAPLDRVVEAIYWAIDQNVNIMNISFGTPYDSDVLRQAIKDAYKAGILIVAAAGNHGVVEYPAAYNEVLAVGSVNAQGIISDYSATGEQLELVAPGEQILSSGDFGGVVVCSGTSMAAPHVVGIASLLWQRDTSVSAEFIRSLLDASANLYGEQDEYGYGLVDFDYAMKIYDDYKLIFEKNTEEITFEEQAELVEGNLLQNDNGVAVFDDVDYVVGSWGDKTHELYVSDNVTLAETHLKVKALKAGATANDRFISGMLIHPQWHGYWKKVVNDVKQYNSNYVASYIYLTKMARVWDDRLSYINSYTDPERPSWMRMNDYYGLTGVVSDDLFNNYPWSTALVVKTGKVQVTDSARARRYFMYGVALHSATDAFAHDTYKKDSSYINHDSGADKVSTVQNRYSCAMAIAKIVVEHAMNDEEGSAADFIDVVDSTYNKSFKMRKLDVYVNEIDSNLISSYSDTTQGKVSYMTDIVD